MSFWVQKEINPGNGLDKEKFPSMVDWSCLNRRDQRKVTTLTPPTNRENNYGRLYMRILN